MREGKFGNFWCIFIIFFVFDESKEKDMALEDVHMMQDEIDHLKQEAEKAAIYQAALDNAKRKLSDYSVLNLKINQKKY